MARGERGAARERETGSASRVAGGRAGGRAQRQHAQGGVGHMDGRFPFSVWKFHIASLRLFLVNTTVVFASPAPRPAPPPAPFLVSLRPPSRPKSLPFVRVRRYVPCNSFPLGRDYVLHPNFFLMPCPHSLVGSHWTVSLGRD